LSHCVSAGSKLPSLANGNMFVQIGTWLIAVMFALRTVGDYPYFGFFQRHP